MPQTKAATEGPCEALHTGNVPSSASTSTPKQAPSEPFAAAGSESYATYMYESCWPAFHVAKASLIGPPAAPPSGSTTVVKVAQSVERPISEFISAAGTAAAAPCESTAPAAAVSPRPVVSESTAGKPIVLLAPVVADAITKACRCES